MKREIIAILTLWSFIVFSFSCYSVKQIKPEMLSAPDADKIKIFKMDKTSGESIVFSKSDPGRVSGNYVAGTGTLTTALEIVEIASANVQTTNYHQDENFISITTRDGKSYDCMKVIKQGDKSVLYILKAVTNKVNSFIKLSLSEVERAWEKRFNFGATFGLAVLSLYAIVGIYFAIAGPINFGSDLFQHWPPYPSPGLIEKLQ